MSQLIIRNVRIAGMAACVPSRVEENLSLPIFKDESEAKSYGLDWHRKATSGTIRNDSI